MNGVNGGKLGCVAAKPNLCISNAEASFKKNPGICFIIRKLILIFAMLRGLSPQRDILKKRLLDASILTSQELRNFPKSLCQNWSNSRCHVGYVTLSAVSRSLIHWGSVHRAYLHILRGPLRCSVPYKDRQCEGLWTWERATSTAPRFFV